MQRATLRAPPSGCCTLEAREAARLGRVQPGEMADSVLGLSCSLRGLYIRILCQPVSSAEGFLLRHA